MLFCCFFLLFFCYFFAPQVLPCPRVRLGVDFFFAPDPRVRLGVDFFCPPTIGSMLGLTFKPLFFCSRVAAWARLDLSL